MSMSTMMNDQRDRWLSMRRGLAGRCPHCGEGHLFKGFLKVAPHCDVCGEHFHHHRADDLPAYIVIFVVGHIVVGGMLSAETHYDWPVWLHVMLWPLLTVVLSLGMLQPVKGVIVALQWANRMHGFNHHQDGDDHAALRPHGETRP
jgi:uncharacterized protein (DUF983 family)